MRKISMMASVFVLAAAVVAQAAAPAQVVEARQKSLKEIGQAMKGALDSFKSGAPDLALVRVNAAIIAANADRLPAWFPAGTAQGGAVKTAARPEIWADKAGFAKAAADFSAAAKGFKRAADSGDLAATSKAMATLGGTCKGCHEKFRAKDHD